MPEQGSVVHTVDRKHRRFEVFEGEDGRFFWRAVNKDTDEINATGGEGFETAEEAEADLEAIFKAARED